MADTTTELEREQGAPPEAAPSEVSDVPAVPAVPAVADADAPEIVNEDPQPTADSEPASTETPAEDISNEDESNPSDGGSDVDGDDDTGDDAGEPAEGEDAQNAPAEETSALYNYIPNAKKGKESEAIVLNGRFDVFPARPIQDLDTPSARAFHAEDRNDSSRRIMALVTIPGMPVRAEELEDLADQEIPGLLPLIDFGNVFWRSVRRETMVLIYQRPMGGKFVEVLRAESQEFRRQDYINQVLTAITAAIQQLSTRDMAHRGIRSDNIYFLDDARQEAVLGDSLSAPPGYNQPLLYETIGRSLAKPAGRGWGNASDDLYALGVMLALVLLGRDPTTRMNDERLLLTKMNTGTYQMLIANSQIAANLLEPLRGLLNDDSKFRWTAEHMETWLGGRRVSPTQGNPATKSQRGLTFGNIEHFTMRTLAYSMAKDRVGSLELIRSGRLELWLSRGLDAKELAATISSFVHVANAQRNDKPDADDVLLSRVLMYLDPSGPIRYKNSAFMPDGFGPAMAVEYLETGEAKQSVEALSQELVSIWYAVQESLGQPQPLEAGLYEKMATHLKKAAPGYGMERCLYELNVGLPCLSPLVNHRHVTSCKTLLLALDEAEGRTDTTKTPLDRHIAAYIATHYEGAADRHLDEAGDPDETVRMLATLRLFAAMQDRLGPETLAGMARWLGGLTSPIIKLYQSRATRQRMESELPRLIRQGELAPMIRLLDDPEARREDELEFEAAVEAFRLAEEEVREIQERTKPGSQIAERRGRQAAATLSVLIMIFIVTMLWLTG